MSKENGGQAVARGAMLEAQAFLCGQMQCVKEIGLPVTLDIPEMGSIVMQPWEDPGQVVELFRQEVLATGGQVLPETLAMLLQHFCFSAFEHSQLSALSQPCELEKDIIQNIFADASSVGFETASYEYDMIINGSYAVVNDVVYFISFSYCKDPANADQRCNKYDVSYALADGSEDVTRADELSIDVQTNFVGKAVRFFRNTLYPSALDKKCGREQELPLMPDVCRDLMQENRITNTI
jgi:hypothetical protein